MPSGKKKRKAIRKKKELVAHLVNGSLGDSNERKDLSSQDEEDSCHVGDGDVGLPASHGCHLTFTGKSEEPTADGNKSVEAPKLKEESSRRNGDVETGPVSNGSTFVAIEPLRETHASPVHTKKLEDEGSSVVLDMGTTQVKSFIQITDPLPLEVTEVVDSTNSIAQNSEDTSLVGTDTELLKNPTDSEMILESKRTMANVVSPASWFESGSMKFGAKVCPVSTDSGIPDSDTKNKEPELLQSSDSVNCEANDGLKLTEDAGVTKFSEKQPLVVPVPRVAERTSWMNCCGILDLCSGSSR